MGSESLGNGKMQQGKNACDYQNGMSQGQNQEMMADTTQAKSHMKTPIEKLCTGNQCDLTAFNRSLCPLSGVRLAGARGESRPGAVTQEEATRGRNVGDSNFPGTKGPENSGLTINRGTVPFKKI